MCIFINDWKWSIKSESTTLLHCVNHFIESLKSNVNVDGFFFPFVFNKVKNLWSIVSLHEKVVDIFHSILSNIEKRIFYVVKFFEY
nr:MAG TPA: hypothetical protein [Bacteriophage sp.]